ncbi:hypothetical protein GL273_01255 [Aeromonas jandaei]|uniref:ZirU family protein n=1 Tax=Aeromonas jandaei TaxID=650 RepID=UPI001C5AF236|nr:ZirU family protein [Aeromonas jandaei]MBW3804454.1 hypothetical protein [Aeromonas jandaei]
MLKYSAVVFVLVGVSLIVNAARAITSPQTNIVMGRPPSLTSGEVILTGNSGEIVGDVISINPIKPFLFNDVDGDLTTGNTYQWLRNGQPIAGATSDTYTITRADLGASIILRAIPNTNPLTTLPSVGLPVDSNTIVLAAEGEVYEATITGLIEGKPLVGSELTVLTKCVEGPCDLNRLEFQWQIEERDEETGRGTGGFVDISGATKQKLIPTKDMQKLKIKVLVTKK